MAEIVEVKKKEAPVESVTVKLTRADAGEIVAALDSARAGRRYYFDVNGGRSKIAVKLEDAVNGTFTLAKYQENLSRALKDIYADVKF